MLKWHLCPMGPHFGTSSITFFADETSPASGFNSLQPCFISNTSPNAISPWGQLSPPQRKTILQGAPLHVLALSKTQGWKVSQNKVCICHYANPACRLCNHVCCYSTRQGTVARFQWPNFKLSLRFLCHLDACVLTPLYCHLHSLICHDH